MKDEHGQSARNDEPGPIGDVNIERLIGRAYEPETLDKDFAASVVEDMLALARDEADGRARRQRTLRLVGRGVVRWGPLAAAAAIMIAFLAAKMGTVERPVGEGVPAVARPPAGKDLPANPAMMPGMLTARARPASRAGKPIAVGAVIRTQPRQRRRAVLTDGSVLYVNQDTQVQVTGRRRLSLRRGEVYVEVQPEGPDLLGQPVGFVIQTPAREVVAVGTRLGVNVSRGKTGVCVTQGKARVSGVAGLLHAGQQLRGNDNTPTVLPRATYVLDWTEDLMAAAESPLVPKSRHAGGALVAVDPGGQEMKLSLRKYHVDVHIEDGFARTTIDQTYFNHTQRRLEGTFYFPLPPDASLSRLAMYVEGKLNEGGMVERDRARAVYESIVYKMKDPALLEWVDGTTFKMRIFPLFGRREKRIILSYTQKLPVAYGRTAYRFPAGHSMQNVGKWSFRALIRDGAGAAWQCDSHELTEASKQRDLILTARAENIKPDTDVVLNLMDPAGEPGGADGVEFSSAVHEASKYLMLRYRPNLPVVKRRPKRHWVFLFESSADRDPLLARAQIEVIRGILQGAEHDDTFALVTAGTRARVFSGSEGAIAASPGNVGVAVDFLDNTHLIGALDLGQALAVAGKLCESGDNAHLVHVGAGVPALGVRDQKSLLGRLPAGATYVGVGVGKRWSRSFMKAAAAATGGYYTQINPDENITWRAFELVSTLNTPRLLNVRVEAAPPWTGGEFLCHNDSVAHGEQICAILRVAKGHDLPRTVTVTGLLDGEEWSASAAVRNVAPKAGYLPRIWARLEIDRLLGEDPQKNHKKIVKLSKAMYVMSPFTSLLVLENEAMYKQYKVDRGRKDHWALYQCPKQIKVVHEPLPTATAPATRAAKKKKPPTKTKTPWQKPVLDTIVVRVTRPFFQRPARGQAPPAVLGTVRAMAPGASASVTSAGLKAPPGMSVLKTDLPDARFIGTPKNITADNFPPGGPKPDKPLFVPVGVENLARGRAITGSDDEPIIGDLDYITDGDKEAQAGSFVELGPGKQYVQIDLGAVSEVFAVVVWHDHRTPQVFRDVVAQVSNDEHFIDKKTVFNNDHDNSSGLGLGKDFEWIETNQGKIMPAGGVKGRYVRLYSNGGTASDENTYTEVEVYGRPKGGASLQGRPDQPTSVASGPNTDLLEALAASAYLSPVRIGEFYVIGEVPRPGVYSLTGRRMTIKQALAASAIGMDIGTGDPTVVNLAGTFLDDIQANFLMQATTRPHALWRTLTAPRITLINGQRVYVIDQRAYVSNYVFAGSGSMRTGPFTLSYGTNSYWGRGNIPGSLAREINGDGIFLMSDGRGLRSARAEMIRRESLLVRALDSPEVKNTAWYKKDPDGALERLSRILNVTPASKASLISIKIGDKEQDRIDLAEIANALGRAYVDDRYTQWAEAIAGDSDFEGDGGWAYERFYGGGVGAIRNFEYKTFSKEDELFLRWLPKPGYGRSRLYTALSSFNIPDGGTLLLGGLDGGSGFYSPTYHIGARDVYLMDTAPYDEKGVRLGGQRWLTKMKHSTFNIRGLPTLYNIPFTGHLYDSYGSMDYARFGQRVTSLDGSVERHNVETQGVLMDNIRSVVPWWKELTYPRDWREITSRRTRFGVTDDLVSKRDRMVREHLKKTVRELNFDDIELKDVIQFLRDVSGENIYVRWSALNAAGITKATTVNVHLTEVSLEKSLRIVLEDVGAAAPLGYVVDSGVISISTQDDLDTKTITRVYDIRDLLVRIPQFRGSPVRTGGWGGGGGGGRAHLESKQNRRVRERLKANIREISFEDIALKDAIQVLRDVSGVNIYVKWAALNAAGITRTTSANANLTDVTLDKALRVTLEDVGAAAPLGYVVDSGVISISTEDDLATKTITRVYNIRDLMLGESRAVDRQALINDIIALLKATIAPDVWYNVNEVGITELHGQLVITQTAENHEKIVDLLGQLRESTGLASYGAGSYQPGTPTMRVTRALHRWPKFTGRQEFFTNLTVYAPGLNTTTVDILAALEADAPEDARPKRGGVDIEARKLIAAARAAGWQTVSLTAGSDKPGLVITFDGAGRYAYSRVCTGGLAERVICDGSRLLHLYDQIGLGAVRKVSRFHRAELMDTIPWLVAPADDLAVGADISLKDQRTVAITPLGAKDRKTKDGKQAAYVEIHLVFGSQGRLAERQIFLMPKGKMIGRITYGEDGLVKLLGGDQKVLSERKYEVRPAAAPNLKPDLSKLVILPMPRRTLDHFERTRKLKRDKAATWSEADALAYVAATGPGQRRYLWGKEGFIERRFIKKGDRRMGFYVLLAEQNRWPVLAKELADRPLGKYLAALAKTAKTGNHEPVGDAGKGFIGRLGGFRDLWYRVKNSKMHQDTTPAAKARDAWRDDVLAYVRGSGPDLFGWALLSEGMGLAGKWKDADGAAKALDGYAKYPALRYIARYEAARALCASGKSESLRQGRERFKKLYGETLADGLLGAFDQSFYKATAGHGWTKLIHNAAGELVKKNARFAAVVLARQCQQVGDWKLGREVLAKALTGAPKRQELPLKLAAFAHYRRGNHWADADQTLLELLEDKRLAKSPWMWRAAADIAFKRGRTASAVQRLDRALDIEYRRLPEKVDVRAVRAAFGHLMGEYAKLCQVVATLEDEPPKKMLAGLVRAADRWRTLDVDPAPACHSAAKALRRLGANELAWDYLTTPLASKPNEAGPWVDLAAELAGEGDVDLADRAYAAAFDIEPTNAQILWDRAQLLSRHGRGEQAAGIYRQISKGSWQPKHESIKERATEAMEEMKR